MMTPPSFPLITIDSNCVIGLFDRTSATATSVDELRNLMRYALSGVIRIAVTTKVEVDFARGRTVCAEFCEGGAYITEPTAVRSGHAAGYGAEFYSIDGASRVKSLATATPFSRPIATL